MNRVFLVALFTLPTLAMGQSSYGFGMIIIKNDTKDGVTKEIFISKVLNLDSLKFVEKQTQIGMSKKKKFDRSLSHWALRKIEREHPEKLSPETEITIYNEVELLGDFPQDPQERLNRQLKKLNRRKKTIFMDRSMAESKRRTILNVSYNDIHGSVFLME
jgi:hypothetical protein